MEDKLQLVDMVAEDTQMNVKDKEWYRLWHAAGKKLAMLLGAGKMLHMLAAAAGEKKKKAQNNNVEELGFLVVLLKHGAMQMAPATVRTR